MNHCEVVDQTALFGSLKSDLQTFGFRNKIMPTVINCHSFKGFHDSGLLLFMKSWFTDMRELHFLNDSVKIELHETHDSVSFYSVYLHCSDHN